MSSWKIYKEKDAANVLKAILQSDFVKAELAGLEKAIADDTEGSGYPRRNTDYQTEVLDRFFEQDLSDLFKVKVVWEWFLNELNREVFGIDISRKHIETLDSGDRLESERTMGDITKEIDDEVTRLYEEMLDSIWRGLTVEEATAKLPKGAIYVAVLDEKGKLTREPFPAISTNKYPNMQITAKIEMDTAGFRPTRWLHIAFSESISCKGISDEAMKVSGHAHRAKGNDAETVIITL